MEIKIRSAVEIDKRFEDYIRAKFQRLEKFIFDKEKGSAEILIKKEGPMYISEIKLFSKRTDIFLREESNDINKSIENLFDRVKRQVRKQHDRVIQEFRGK